MQNLLFILTLIAPVFIIVVLGYLLRKMGIINDNFVSVSSKIVFSVSLPALIFLEVSSIGITQALNIDLLIFILIGTLISFLLIWFFTVSSINNGKDRGVFIQGSFRGNFAIIGLAVIANYYGPDRLGKASLLLAFIIPLYNVLSVIALTVPVRKEKQVDYKKTFLEIAKNPLILAVIFAIPFSIFAIDIPPIIIKTGTYLSSLALPLALIGIGGYLNFKDVKRASGIAFTSTVIKLILIPLSATYAGYLLGFSGENLGFIFILFGCPTAIASFIMAEAMGMNGKLAGNILLLTTLFSVLTLTLGLFILKQNNLI